MFSRHERNFHAVDKELPVFTCYRCKFSRAEGNFHAVDKKLPVFTCHHCKFSSLLQSKLQQHIESDNQKLNN